MSYLKLKDATFIKNIGVNPIYECQGKFYIGIETLNGMGEEIENCVDCETMEEVETWCKNMGNCFDDKKQEIPTITLDNFLKLGNDLSLNIEVLRNLGNDYESVFSGTISDYMKLDIPIESEVIKWSLDFDSDVYMEIFVK